MIEPPVPEAPLAPERRRWRRRPDNRLAPGHGPCTIKSHCPRARSPCASSEEVAGSSFTTVCGMGAVLASSTTGGLTRRPPRRSGEDSGRSRPGSPQSGAGPSDGAMCKGIACGGGRVDELGDNLFRTVMRLLGFERHHRCEWRVRRGIAMTTRARFCDHRSESASLMSPLPNPSLRESWRPGGGATCRYFRRRETAAGAQPPEAAGQRRLEGGRSDR